MQQTIDETNRRRSLQLKYNEEHGIVPRQIKKKLGQNSLASLRASSPEEGKAEARQHQYEATPSAGSGAMAAEPEWQYLSKPVLEKRIDEVKRRMQEAAKKLDFVEAAALRDEWLRMQVMLEERGDGTKPSSRAAVRKF